MCSSDLVEEGPRLRQGHGAMAREAHPSFEPHAARVIEGTANRPRDPLHSGSLALDPVNQELYALIPEHGAGRPGRILVFREGPFGGGLVASPARVMADTPAELRILAHAPQSGWLAGAGCTPAACGTDPDDDDATPPRRPSLGREGLYLWKEPREGKPPLHITRLPGASRILGLALAGS